MNNKTNFILLLLILSTLLSSCSIGETDWIEVFFDTWSEAKGVALVNGLEVDGVKVIEYVVDQAFGTVTNSDEATGLDAAEATINQIKEADQIMADALEAGDLGKLKEAQALRPEDVTYVEAEAAGWIQAGNNAAAETAIAKSDNVTVNIVMSGQNCRITRLNQLRIRRETLLKQADSITHNIHNNNQNQLFEMADEATAEINALTSGAPSPFCAQFGKDN